MEDTMKHNDQLNLAECLAVCERAARAGGAVVQDWADRFQARGKSRSNDLVTQADLDSQDAIRRIVLDAFPDHVVLGEEEGLGHETRGARSDDDTYRWVADPLDGTTNYVHRVPHYCVSLAMERAGRPLVGVVYDPNRDECFAAQAGAGAWCNGEPITTSGATGLDQTLAVAGFPYDLNLESPDLKIFLDIAPRCRSVRRTGSAALNLSYVAAGRFDMYWSYSTKIWDVAAGALLVEQAGGVVSATDGGPFDLDRGHLLAAATPELHAELLATVRRVGA